MFRICFLSIAVFLMGVLLVACCDVLYGVRRIATIPNSHNLDCVRAVLQRTPGIQAVVYEHSEGSRPLTITGMKPPDQIHKFSYKGDQVQGILMISIDYTGKATLYQSLAEIGRRPPQSFIDNTLPIMRLVERELESQCGIRRLPGSIDEYCYGVECPPEL